MNGINQVLLFGTVGSDPETRIINENMRVSAFRLATNENFTDKTGVKKEITEWHNIEAWGQISDLVANYIKKGTHIIVQGKLKTDSYDDKNNPGKKVYRAKVVMESVNFIPNGKKPEEQNGQQPAQQQYQTQQSVQQQPVYQPVQQPVYQPVQQQPVQHQPVYQPVQQPVYQPVQQPVYQPVQQQPVQHQPVQQQPNQAVNTYMTSEQFIPTLNAPDDLPF